MSQSKDLSFKQAIVIGGSITGLLTARVLSDLFEIVILIEKDPFPAGGPDYRKGLPQAKHQHILLQKGRDIFEQLFPGFDAKLKYAGAPLADYTNDFVLFSSAGRLPRFTSNIDLRLSRRIYIDWIVFNYLKKIKNIDILENTQIEKLQYSDETVTGVSLKNGDSYTADLVVDATGRGSKMPRWLRNIGHSPAEEEIIDAKLGYASRLYEKSDDKPFNFQAVEVSSIPIDNPRAAGLWGVEDNKWLLTLIGTAGHYPPLTDNEFNAFAKNLSDPLVYNTIKELKPCSKIVGFRGTANRWRHYEKLKTFPNGLIVIGDAFCAFSPLYGQGMTVSALSAMALKETIVKSKNKEGFNGKKLKTLYFIKASKIFKSAWLLATSEDMRWPTTVGSKPNWSTKLSYQFMDMLMPLSTSSKRLVKNFLRISNMTASPIILIDPRILFQLMIFNIKKLISQNIK